MTQFRKNSKYIKQMRAIAREHGCRLYFRKSFKDIANGTYGRKTRAVTLATEGRSLERILSTFCHEMAHHFCYEQGKYKSYHFTNEDIKDATHDEIIQLFENYIRTALKAERYVDRWGGRLMKEWFPGVRFLRAYVTPERVKWFQKRQLAPIRLNLYIAKIMKEVEENEKRDRERPMIAISVDRKGQKYETYETNWFTNVTVEDIDENNSRRFLK